jgi:hypothetical protein
VLGEAAWKRSAVCCAAPPGSELGDTEAKPVTSHPHAPPSCLLQSLASELGDKEAKSVKWYIQRNRDRLALPQLLTAREAHLANGQQLPGSYAEGLARVPSLPESLDVGGAARRGGGLFPA